MVVFAGFLAVPSIAALALVGCQRLTGYWKGD